MAQGFGYEGYVGFGAESTYGTPVTRTVFHHVNKEGLAMDPDAEEGNDTYRFVKSAANIVQGRRKVGGPVELDLRYRGFEKLFKHALGTHEYVAAGTDAADGTQHSMWMTEALPTGLTFEVGRDVGAFLYHGCKVNGLTLNGDTSGIATIGLDLICEDEGTAAASTPTFESSAYAMQHQSALSLASGTRPVRGFSIKVDNNLTDDRYWIGSRLIKEPLRAGRASVSGELQMEFDRLDDWQTFQAAGTAALSISYTGAIITGTIADKMQFDLPHIRLTKVNPQVSDSGPILITVPFEAYASGTTQTTVPLRLQMVNITNGTDV